MRSKILLPALAFSLLAPGPAYAHTGASAVFSFSSGFLHPVGGLDHLLAMFAVGLLGTQLGGRALWLVPSAFIAMMIGGAGLGFTGIGLPGVEYAISLSLVVIALPVALPLKVPSGVAMLLVGIFAIFHGSEHAAELPAEAGMAVYMAGFAVATALIHATGIGFGLVMKGMPARAAAAAVGAIGLAFLVA